MNFQSDDFELFGLPRQFAQQADLVDARWKALQREAHPDRFAAQGAAAQRLAMQWSVRINEAYQRLKQPLRRAAYLCELAGVPVQAHSNTAMPAQFLVQQITWREALEEAQSPEQLAQLLQEVQASAQHLLGQCALHIDGTHDFAAAVADVRALMFLEKFALDLHQRMDQLD